MVKFIAKRLETSVVDSDHLSSRLLRRLSISIRAHPRKKALSLWLMSAVAHPSLGSALLVYTIVLKQPKTLRVGSMIGPRDSLVETGGKAAHLEGGVHSRFTLSVTFEGEGLELSPAHSVRDLCSLAYKGWRKQNDQGKDEGKFFVDHSYQETSPSTAGEASPFVKRTLQDLIVQRVIESGHPKGRGSVA